MKGKKSRRKKSLVCINTFSVSDAGILEDRLEDRGDGGGNRRTDWL